MIREFEVSVESVTCGETRRGAGGIVTKCLVLALPAADSVTTKVRFCKMSKLMTKTVSRVYRCMHCTSIL